MFSTEQNGYNKQEVDKFIAKLKASHEASLMEEKLKVLESENKLLDFKKRSLELENREKNIKSALDEFKKVQDEGSKNINALRLEQLNMIYQEFLLVIKELSLRYKGIEHNKSLIKIINALDTIVNKVEEDDGLTTKTNTENDSMRILLNKMQGYKKAQDNPREVKINRADERKNQVKPITNLQLEENDNYSTLADKFLATAPEEPKAKAAQFQSNGFDLKEAINPKDDLEEIMKAFDFYGGNCGDN